MLSHKLVTDFQAAFANLSTAAYFSRLYHQRHDYHMVEKTLSFRRTKTKKKIFHHDTRLHNSSPIMSSKQWCFEDVITELSLTGQDAASTLKSTHVQIVCFHEVLVACSLAGGLRLYMYTVVSVALIHANSHRCCQTSQTCGFWCFSAASGQITPSASAFANLAEKTIVQKVGPGGDLETAVFHKK